MSDMDMGAVALSVSQTVSVWTVLMPPLSDVRRHTPGSAPEFAADVRHAEIIAASLALTVGGIMSYAARNRMPLLASALLVGSLVTAYETTLRSPGHTARVSVIHTNEEEVTA